MANVFLREYFSGKEISYPINPFQMLTDLQIAFLLRPFKKYTTLKKKASMYDKNIFIADKISWDQKGVPPYYDILKEKVVESLDEACYFYINYQFENKLLLMPHQWIKEASVCGFS